MAPKPSPRGEGGPAGPDEGKLCHGNSFAGSNGTPAPHQSAGGAADSFPQGGSPDCQKSCAHPLAPSARGLRPQAVGERTVRPPEIFRAMARFSPSAPTFSIRQSRCFLTYWGDHWSPVNLPQQRIFRDSFLQGKRARASNARPRPSQKLHFCLIAHVGATIGRPPAWRSNVLSEMAFLQGIRARASNARPYRSFSTV